MNSELEWWDEKHDALIVAEPAGERFMEDHAFHLENGLDRAGISNKKTGTVP